MMFKTSYNDYRSHQDAGNQASESIPMLKKDI